MRFVFALLATCFLLLSLSSGAAANVALESEPTGVEMLLHHEGDRDEVPDCPLSSGAHHHHSMVGEHQLAVPDANPGFSVAESADQSPMRTRDILPPGMSPAFEPHPPKA